MLRRSPWVRRQGQPHRILDRPSLRERLRADVEEELGWWPSPNPGDPHIPVTFSWRVQSSGLLAWGSSFWCWASKELGIQSSPNEAAGKDSNIQEVSYGAYIEIQGLGAGSLREVGLKSGHFMCLLVWDGFHLPLGQLTSAVQRVSATCDELAAHGLDSQMKTDSMVQTLLS